MLRVASGPGQEGSFLDEGIECLLLVVKLDGALLVGLELLEFAMILGADDRLEGVGPGTPIPG